MTIVYEPLKTALQSLNPGEEQASAAVAVWLGPEPDGINFIYCADTREERLRLASLLASALCSMLSLTDEDMAPQPATYVCDLCKDGLVWPPGRATICAQCGNDFIPF